MNTIKIHPEIAEYCQKRMYAVAARIDANVYLVVKPKPFWMPSFIYKAVVRGHVEIVEAGSFSTMAYVPEI